MEGRIQPAAVPVRLKETNDWLQQRAKTGSGMVIIREIDSVTVAFCSTSRRAIYSIKYSVYIGSIMAPWRCLILTSILSILGIPRKPRKPSSPSIPSILESSWRVYHTIPYVPYVPQHRQRVGKYRAVCPKMAIVTLSHDSGNCITYCMTDGPTM